MRGRREGIEIGRWPRTESIKSIDYYNPIIDYSSDNLKQTSIEKSTKETLMEVNDIVTVTDFSECYRLSLSLITVNGMSLMTDTR